MQPTLGVDHVRCRVGPVEVALHHLRTAHPYFADLARLGIDSAGEVDNARLGVGCAHPNRSELERRASGRRAVGDRAGLGHAVALTNDAAEARRAALRQVLAERRRAREDQPHAAQVVLVRHHPADRHPVALHRLEETLEIEPRQRDDRAPPVQASAHDHDQTVDVIEGQHRDRDVVFADEIDVDHLRQVGHQVAVGEHDPLGQPGGAARVGQSYQVLARVDGDRGRRAVSLQ